MGLNPTPCGTLQYINPRDSLSFLRTHLFALTFSLLRLNSSASEDIEERWRVEARRLLGRCLRRPPLLRSAKRRRAKRRFDPASPPSWPRSCRRRRSAPIASSSPIPTTMGEASSSRSSVGFSRSFLFSRSSAMRSIRVRLCFCGMFLNALDSISILFYGFDCLFQSNLVYDGRMRPCCAYRWGLFDHFCSEDLKKYEDAFDSTRLRLMACFLMRLIWFWCCFITLILLTSVPELSISLLKRFLRFRLCFILSRRIWFDFDVIFGFARFLESHCPYNGRGVHIAIFRRAFSILLVPVPEFSGSPLVRSIWLWFSLMSSFLEIVSPWKSM